MKETKHQKFKIGEAAEKVGLSVRSLRHLDKQGILTPSYREPNGNRFCSERDIEIGVMAEEHQMTVEQFKKHIALAKQRCCPA